MLQHRNCEYVRMHVYVRVQNTEPVFLNGCGAQKSIPRNEFRQPMYPGGPVR